MKVELRADGIVHISGYVNVTGRESRPVMTKHGKMPEMIEPGSFQRAIDANEAGISVLLDHDPSRRLAGTADGTLMLYEDNIGLRATTEISDPEVVEAAKNKKIRGWSFNMRNVVDEVEERAGKSPLRHVKSFDMDEISLVVKKIPVYSATSVEVRANEETDVEERGMEETVEVKLPEKKKEPEDANKKFKERLQAIKKGE